MEETQVNWKSDVHGASNERGWSFVAETRQKEGSAIVALVHKDKLPFDNLAISYLDARCFLIRQDLLSRLIDYIPTFCLKDLRRHDVFFSSHQMTPLITTIMDKVMSLFEEKANTEEVFNIHE